MTQGHRRLKGLCKATCRRHSCRGRRIASFTPRISCFDTGTPIPPPPRDSPPATRYAPQLRFSMSFDNFDLEHRSGASGGIPPKTTSSQGHRKCLFLCHPTATQVFFGPDLDDFEGFKNSVSLQIFKVNSNVQGINRLIDKLGTVHDGAGLRKSL